MKKRVAILAVSAALAQMAMAQTIIYHNGNNDPLSEGFSKIPVSTLTPFGTNDAGTLAWVINDNSTASDSRLDYRYTTTASEATTLSNKGWQIIANFRMLNATDTVVDNTARSIELGFTLNSGTGDRRYGIDFGISSVNPNDASVKLLNEPSNVPFYVAGKGTGYHQWVLRKPAGTDVAQLLVDGNPVPVATYAGFANSDNPGRLYFGSLGEGSVGQGNWNQVLLEVPEPSQMALLSLAGGWLIFSCMRRRGGS
jgi:hypothetical protein